jgi:Tol biopolymer transport system component
MRQEKGLYRGVVILAVVTLCILVMIVPTLGSKNAAAKLAQDSIYVSSNQGPETNHSNPQAPDPTKKADKKQDPKAPKQADKKITICHVPSGNPANAHTITISVNAWKTDGKGQGGHGPGLHGGDYVGSCRTTVGVQAGTAIPNATPSGVTSSLPEAWIPLTVGASVCADWMVYHTNQTGSWEIFRLGNIPDRPGATANLSQGPEGKNTDNIGPSLSPDRRWITFASNRDGGWEVYIAATDGTSRQRVTYYSPATSTDPVWSPDGSRIVYESNDLGNWNLYSFNVQTGQETLLTDANKAYTNAYWSPDSQNLVFEAIDNGLSQLYLYSFATGQAARLSDGNGNDHNPIYSPDGQHIAFFSYRNSTNAVLYVMNSFGNEVMAISDPAGSVLNPSWSPDSTLIAYQLMQGIDLGIYVYQTVTKQTRRVTDVQSMNYAPTWACNGPTLIFTSDITGNPNLFTTQALPMEAKPIQLALQAQQLTSGQAASQYAVDSPGEEDASTFGPQAMTLVLPELGGSSSCGTVASIPIQGSDSGFPVISTTDCGTASAG